jgi:hypothetical protein
MKSSARPQRINQKQKVQSHEDQEKSPDMKATKRYEKPKIDHRKPKEKKGKETKCNKEKKKDQPA